MSRRGPEGLAHSIQERLRNVARERGRPFAELVELYAIERLLDRLGRSQHRDHFVLKGALALRQWLGHRARPTRDIDLLGPAGLDEPALISTLAEILDTESSDDGMQFDPTSIAVRPIRSESEVVGLRARLDARLGQVRLRYQVDVGLGDALYPPATEVVPGGLLGLSVASVRAYTPYTMVAEKLEAMAVLGDANSRTKDYFDLSQMSLAIPFDGAVLAESIRRTFARRGTPVPSGTMPGLSEAFARTPLHANRWRAFLARMGSAGEAADLTEVVADIAAFARPVLDAARDAVVFHCHWMPGGPWKAGELPRDGGSGS